MLGRSLVARQGVLLRPLPAQAAGAGTLRIRARSSLAGTAGDGAVDLARARIHSSTFRGATRRWRRVPLARADPRLPADGGGNRRRRRASPRWPTTSAASCCCRTRIRARTHGDAGTGSIRRRRAAGARPRSSPRRCARCGASTGSTASACSSPGCRRAARSRPSLGVRQPGADRRRVRAFGRRVRRGIVAAGGARRAESAAPTPTSRGSRARRARGDSREALPVPLLVDPRRRRRRRRAGQRRAARPAVPRAQRPSRRRTPAPTVDLPPPDRSRRRRRAGRLAP